MPILKLRAMKQNGEFISRYKTRNSIACEAVILNQRVSENAKETQYLTKEEK